MSARLDWARDGVDWPNRDASRFVRAGDIDWHVQVAGDGPALLLLHGTGAATHSWAGLLPLLARAYRVIAPDLPGHGFSSPRPSGLASLPWMARSAGSLLVALGEAPVGIVGHSAGAALAARMVLDGQASPAGIVAINGALLPFPGMAAQLAPALAKLLFLNPFVPRLMAWRARAEPGAVERLIAGTGSVLPPAQMARYAQLFRNGAHCDAALAMMANWDLAALERDLPALRLPVTLVTGERDLFVPPAKADAAAALMPNARVVRLPGLGHLAHEEDAARVADAIAPALSAAAAASGSATAPAAPPAAPPPAASGRAA